MASLSTNSLKLSSLPSVESPVHFVSHNVPFRRRLQTFAVFFWTAMLPISTFIFLILCSIPTLWPIIIIYLIWIWKFDEAPSNGGRSTKFMRDNWIWTSFKNYYPVSLIKTADLPADRTYVFGYHPHGIIGMGAIANFGTDATGFSKLFPGLKPHLLTLSSNFQIPLYRDILLSLGICSVAMKSCNNILAQGPGSALTIVVGGAAESLSAHPGTADLTLKRRLGFIKLAIRSGSDLVPVFSFGENDIFEQLANSKGTKIYKMQKRFQAIFGFTLPIFFGRGLFNYNCGIMPYRHQITSVVGRPIHTTKIANPTMEEIEFIQEQYITELMRVWDDYKDQFATGRTKELSIIA